MSVFNDESMPTDLYAVLGVSENATLQELKQAYRGLARLHHPDKVTEDKRDAATKYFVLLKTAYDVLTEIADRTHYDAVRSCSKTARFLVLIDLNGSLVVRTKGRIPGLRHIHAKNGKYTYPRTHTFEFVERLSTNKSIAFAIYTSIHLHNAIPIIDAALSKSQTFHVYAGDEFNTPDPASGQWETKRCLRKVWAHASCRARGIDFGADNTIVIDNEAPKVRDCRSNAILIENCDEHLLKRGDDDSLLQLADYLEQLALNCKGDVRSYLKRLPFGFAHAEPLAIEPLACLLKKWASDGESDSLEGELINGGSDEPADLLADSLAKTLDLN